MADNLQVTTQQLDDIPVLLAQGKKIGIPELLDQQFLSHGNWQGTSFGWTTMVWLSHILSEGDHRLNQVQPWVEKRPHILEINTGQNVRASELSDDRLGIVLVELANAEKWKAFETELHRRTLRVYNLKPKRVRVDSTTASGYWTVTENGLFQHGHSKDHRPDLPQLKVMMSALDPMGMPVATQVVSGERADDKLYIPAIKQVSASLDEHGLLYVGDCKMAALGIRAFIQNSQDYYLCPLSEVQLPGDALEAYLQPVWNGNKTLTIGNKTITWAERRLVTFSFQYAHAAHEGLHKRLKKAITELLELNEHKQGKRQFENVVGMQIDADKILKRHRVVELIKLNILDESTERHIRAYGDRPARTEIEHSLTLLAETDDLAVQETAAAHQGIYGLQATIDDTNSLYLSDDSALDTPHYRAHFYLDPNSLTMTDSNSHDILVGYNRDHTDSIFRVYFYKSSGQYKLRTSVKTDSVTNTYSSQYVISDDWHQVEIEWQAASAPGANNGYMSLWIDTTLAETISGVDNDTLTMGSMNFGLVSGVDASTSGSMYFDQFESYRTSSHQAFQPDNGWMALAAWHPKAFSNPIHALFQQPDATSTPTPTPTVTATVTATPTQAATATPTLMPVPSGPVTIDYVYDPLNRLTSATYSSGMTYAYSYDAVGNRKSQTITINGTATTTLYEYDVANRLSSVGGVTYTYDDNGNLLSDGTNTYTYDAANRLSSITSGPSFVTSYRYSGLGDRFQETVNGVTTTFTMDLNSGLTQALSDGTYSYLYGLGRIAQTNATSTEYFLGDALGSVRQLADSSGTVTLTRTYDPYGVVTTSNGAGRTSYGYTSEFQGDYSELVYLRARQYSPATGRFLTRDTWGGDANRPGSFNRWSYVEANPIRYSDPTGLCSTCFVFYFAGAGNRGDIDKDYNLFNDLSIGERTLLNKLTPYATVKVIYPYENGIRSTSKIEEVLKDFPKGIPIFNGLSKVIPAALGLNSLGSSKANQTWEDLLGYCPSQDVVVDNSQIKITLIGYSGGSQVAYSTAQELSSRLFIDNLVEIAPTYRAYNQMANIENIWELVGENDDIVDLADSLWHNYNSGYRVEYHDNSYLYGSYETVYDESLDIYKHGANRCNMLNVLGKPYGHSGTGDYFDFNTPTSGTVCNGVKIPNVTTSSSGQAVVDMLVNVIGIGQ